MAVPPRTIDAGVDIGEIFLEKYRVDSILGHGGMGVVALCTHLALNERVAIKMLRRDVLDDADAVERFMREAQAASKLRSEYVARVTDVGRSTANVPYMVMEYLEGQDLGQLLDQRGSLALPWAIELTLQACEALAEAHSIGIVHRDIKPSNLFVTWRPDGSALVKVLDFGISKAITATGMQLTQTQSLLGTPAYMSPEQMRSARMVDARTDIWSLGTVLYELLEGRRPFEAESFSEMCVKVAVDPPAAMTVTPGPLQQVVLRCLEKAPEHRYSSMAELGRDLVPFAQDPHQAQVLAERMSRMLRRSQLHERVLTPPPMPALSSPSLPAAHQSQPVPHVTQPELPGSAEAPGADDPRRSATLAVPRRKRRGSFAIAAALVGATAIGVAISLTQGRPPAAPVRQVAPEAPDPAGPAQPGSAAERGSAVITASPPTPQEPGSAGAPAALDVPKRQGKKPGDRTGRSSTTGPRVAPPGPDCDPFADPHGCKKPDGSGRAN